MRRAYFPERFSSNDDFTGYVAVRCFVILHSSCFLDSDEVSCSLKESVSNYSTLRRSPSSRSSLPQVFLSDPGLGVGTTAVYFSVLFFL